MTQQQERKVNGYSREEAQLLMDMFTTLLNTIKTFGDRYDEESQEAYTKAKAALIVIVTFVQSRELLIGTKVKAGMDFMDAFEIFANDAKEIFHLEDLPEVIEKEKSKPTIH